MEFKSIAHLGRLKEIASVLLKYGFDDVVERLDIPGKELLKRVHPVEHHLSTWERIRHSMEELGPTFIKLGQIMSLRPDLLPAALIEELAMLQDDVAPVPFSEILPVVESALNQRLWVTFSHFDENPLAAASLAQVHRAVLRHNRRIVAVKIQRPGIRSLIERDLSILEKITAYLQDHLDLAKNYDIQGFVKEFSKSLLHELDFTYEARNMRIVRRNFVEQEEIHIPDVYDEYSTETVLTMELVDGTKVKDLGGENQEERKLLAQRGLAAAIKQIMQDGFFHADPHPGNILIMEQNVVCFLDWGIVGRLTRESRYDLVDVLEAFAGRDSEKVLDALLEFVGDPGVRINERALEKDILHIMDYYHDVPMRKLQLGKLLLEVNDLLREHHLKVPRDFALMIKALVTAEGTARYLYPDLDAVKEAEPFIKELAMERWKPPEIWRRVRRRIHQILALQSKLPKRLNTIFDRVERGELQIPLEHRNLEGLQNTLQHVANRLTVGIIAAAMIIGSSLIITTGVPPLLFGYPALGIVGYLFSGILGAWLIISILRN